MPDPVVLALDTSTDVTVGVARGPGVLATARVGDRMAHVESLVPLVHRCLAEAGVSLADVGHVVVGLGPGPFTGLRVGIVSAQVLAHVQGAALHGVCSLDAIALAHASSPSAGGSSSAEGVGGPPPEGGAGSPPEGDFVVATDARRREVYWARYGRDGVRLEGPEVGSPDVVPRLPTVGPGADLYAERLLAAAGPRSLDPGLLAARGLGLPAAGSEPLYLRRPDATEPTRRKSVLRLPPGQGVPR